MKNLLLALLFIVLVLASIFSIPALLKYTLGVEQPMMTVVSSSMWPKLSRGDIVIVKKTTSDEIKVGTVIVFRHEKGLAVHRVISADGWTITTKGDANPVADSPITYSVVVGRVPAIGTWLVKIPWMGSFSLMANPGAGATDTGESAQLGFWDRFKSTLLSPLGFIIIVGFPIIVIFQNYILAGISSILPMSARKRRLQRRVKRLQARWGEEKTKRALRL
jgi:signal peptidase I